MKNDEAIKVFETYLTTGYVPRQYELQEASKSAIIALSSYNQIMKEEMDLEKEIEEYWSTMGWNKVMEIRKFKPIARYFYGLGQLNSK